MVVAWGMLICLISNQVYGIVPHHHHEDEAPAHVHADEHHIGFCHAQARSAELDIVHPEVAPHDEASLASATVRHSTQVVLVMALPDVVDFAFPSISNNGEMSQITYARPYGTGPPGIKSTRAPPASLTA